MATQPVHETISALINPPTDEETLLLFNPSEEDSAYLIHHYILNHPLTKELESNEKFTASRPHLKLPETLRNHNFTGGILMGEEKIPVPPLQFATKDGSEFVSIQYLGLALCGHPNIIHGGLLATLLDEGLARCCFPALPNKVGVTASLTINYRKPCFAGQYVVLKAETTKVDGRKAWVKGRLETLPESGEGEILVEAEALFIEPRQAAVSPLFIGVVHLIDCLLNNFLGSSTRRQRDIAMSPVCRRLDICGIEQHIDLDDFMLQSRGYKQQASRGCQRGSLFMWHTCLPPSLESECAKLWVQPSHLISQVSL